MGWSGNGRKAELRRAPSPNLDHSQPCASLLRRAGRGCCAAMNWYYLDSASAPQGPVQPDALRSLVASGQLAASALVWRDGLSAWLPVEQALRDDAAAALRPSAPDDRPPSPEERSFVDDDGTAYQWSGAERRFLPVASGVEPPPLYDAAQQVMPDDAEPPLPLPPPRRADADGEEEGEEAPARRGGGAGPPASGGQKRQREEAVAKEREKLAQRKERAAAPRAEGTKARAPALLLVFRRRVSHACMFAGEHVCLCDGHPRRRDRGGGGGGLLQVRAAQGRGRRRAAGQAVRRQSHGRAERRRACGLSQGAAHNAEQSHARPPHSKRPSRPRSRRWALRAPFWTARSCARGKGRR